MSKKMITRALALIGLAGALAGCSKEKEIVLRTPGTGIRFGVTTAGSDSATRTEYSGEDENGNAVSKTSVYERVDWVPGSDRILVLCEQAGFGPTADYTLTGATVDAQKSVSGIAPTSGNGLVWGTGEHRFFALYPAPGMESNYDFTDKTVSASNINMVTATGGALITGIIPAEQEVYKVGGEYKANMNYAYMCAGALADSEDTGSVTLSFRPLFTAFEMDLKRIASDPITAKMTKVELSSASTSLAGTFTAGLGLSSDGGLTTAIAEKEGTTGNTVSVTLPDGGVVLGDDPVKITLLAMPVDQKDLTLTLWFEGGSKRVLPLRMGADYITVDACEKLYLRNVGVPFTTWVYTFDVTLSDGTTATTIANDATDFGFKVTSYRTNSSDASTEQVHWTITGYSLDGGTTWLEPDAADATARVVNTDDTLFPDQEGDGSVTAADCEGKLYPNPLMDFDESSIYDDPANPHDLSRYDVNGVPHSDSALETANCYVVTVPGWYKFPCVYGNALKGSASSPTANTSAYTGVSGTTSGFIMESFLRHDGNAITSPWIDENGITLSSAELLWSDSRNLVSDISLEDEGGHKYIKFYVSPDYLHEGNAVIALKNDSGDTVWSWHIWAIDDATAGRNIGTVTITRFPDIATATGDPQITQVGSDGAPVYPDGPVTYRIMKVNLGFCEEHEPRTITIRYVQDGSSETRTLSVTQEGMAMNNPFYQWGRKDPIFPSNGGNATKPTITDASGASLDIVTSTAGTVPQSIQHPSTFYTDGASGPDHSRYDWLRSHRYDNLWNSALGDLDYRRWEAGRPEDSQVRDWRVVKTVYDPCPPGFKVPATAVFTIFNTTGPGVYAQSWVSGETNGRYVRELGVDHYNATNAAAYATDKGFYFYLNAIGSGDTCFFPALGFRRRQNGALITNEYTYWTACPVDCNNHSYAGGIVYRSRTSLESEPLGWAGRAFADIIRPMVDE